MIIPKELHCVMCLKPLIGMKHEQEVNTVCVECMDEAIRQSEVSDKIEISKNIWVDPPTDTAD